MKAITFTALVLLLAAAASAQSGGSFAITQSVIAGGGETSANGPFSVTGTIGQTAVDTNTVGGPYAIRPGFWTSSLAPTAAGVAVSGRVVDASGNGLRNAVITMSDSAGTVFAARTNAFGEFRIEEVRAGETYMVNLSAKGRQFTPQLITVQNTLTGL
ncbi:MAG TPA: carboxypeptidase-like regulatory domain-containing protein, partial [Pyrinomonadaceae bacterium]|nr:carboxypeptidase-like regulatory domain-containing protein [Pyrinomonadaceae bacterium]